MGYYSKTILEPGKLYTLIGRKDKSKIGVPMHVRCVKKIKNMVFESSTNLPWYDAIKPGSVFLCCRRNMQLHLGAGEAKYYILLCGENVRAANMEAMDFFNVEPLTYYTSEVSSHASI